MVRWVVNTWYEVVGSYRYYRMVRQQMKKTTSGPWFAADEFDDEDGYMAVSVMTIDDRMVAKVFGETQEEAMANAICIANLGYVHGKVTPRTHVRIYNG